MAGPKSVKFCTHMLVDRVRSPANFHPTSLTFIFKVKDSIEIHFKWILHSSLLVYGHTSANRRRTDDTNLHDFKGCQEWRWLSFTEIGQRVFAYSVILSEIGMHCILAYCIRCSMCVFVSVWVCACVRACVRVCVHPFECPIVGPHENALR